MVAAFGQEPPQTFVELAQAGDRFLALEPTWMAGANQIHLPVVKDQATKEVVHDWAWRSRQGDACHTLPTVHEPPNGC